jgi:hypothetical protein
MITQEEYLKRNAAICPFCKGDNLEIDKVEMDDILGWGKVQCMDCREAWLDHWKLMEYIVKP